MSKSKKKTRRARPVILVPLALLGIVAILAGWLLDRGGWGSLEARASQELEAVRISEVQNHNVLTLPSPDGVGPSWIELENTGDEAVSLRGLCLTRDSKLKASIKEWCAKNGVDYYISGDVNL